MRNFREQVERIAQVCYAANRAWCELHGDLSQKAWQDTDDELRESMRIGVRAALGGSTPEDSHFLWCRTRVASGWRYGAVKDEDAKTHPCLVPYAELPPVQRAKDQLFVGIVNALAHT